MSSQRRLVRSAIGRRGRRGRARGPRPRRALRHIGGGALATHHVLATHVRLPGCVDRECIRPPRLTQLGVEGGCIAPEVVRVATEQERLAIVTNEPVRRGRVTGTDWRRPELREWIAERLVPTNRVTLVYVPAKKAATTGDK